MNGKPETGSKTPDISIARRFFLFHLQIDYFLQPTLILMGVINIRLTVSRIDGSKQYDANLLANTGTNRVTPSNNFEPTRVYVLLSTMDILFAFLKQSTEIVSGNRKG
jgi:hypothetical protein